MLGVLYALAWGLPGLSEALINDRPFWWYIALVTPLWSAALLAVAAGRRATRRFAVAAALVALVQIILDEATFTGVHVATYLVGVPIVLLSLLTATVRAVPQQDQAPQPG